MNHQDQKTLAYYSMSAYSSHRKREMPVEDFFKVNNVARTNKPMLKFLQKLKDSHRPFYGKPSKE